MPKWDYHSENLTAFTNNWPERMAFLEELDAKGWELLQIIVDEKQNYRAILRRQTIEDEKDGNAR
jgi:hypothetical protein